MALVVSNINCQLILQSCRSRFGFEKYCTQRKLSSVTGTGTKQFVKFFNEQKIPIVGLGLSRVRYSKFEPFEQRRFGNKVEPQYNGVYWYAHIGDHSHIDTTNNQTELEAAIESAINAGYRHFDTAYNYLNENIFGQVLKKCLDSGKVKREELFITTKLPMIAMQPGRVEQFVKKSLNALQLDYVNLYLIHSPFGFQYVNDTEVFPMRDGKILLDLTTDLVGIWKAMELQVDAGRTKAIGLSNFNSTQVQRIVNICRVRPACLQKMEFPQILNDPVVLSVAEKHNKTPAQILIRFLIQQGVVVIPKSVTPERIRKNIEIFDFDLDAKDMTNLDELDKGPAGRSFDYRIIFNGLEEHPENPYLIPY